MLCLLAIGLKSSLAGLDVEAGDYVALPPGTTLFAQYFFFAQRDGVTLTDGTKLDANLDSTIGATRFVHYMDIGGFTVDPQIIIPYGTLTDGELGVVPGGLPLDDSKGFADPVIGATTWLINDPDKDYGTWLGITPWLWVPIGKYDEGQAVNLGENRWKAELQLGYEQGLGNGFQFSFHAGVQWFEDNDDYANELGQSGTLSQDESYQVQTFLTYNFSPATKVSVGYSQLWGGEQKIDGVDNGFSTEWKEFRLSAFHFVSPTIQLQAGLTREFDQEGGFERETQFNLRFLKVFL